ncbi:GNAT family N-acetyltransferase [bacterium]|nr:GNAT family N-acetyltransferase [bacterium]
MRVARADDADDFAAIYRPIVENTFISFEETAPSAADMMQRIVTTLETHPWLVAEEAGAVIAYAYATPHRARAAYRWSCDVSVYVAAHARRRGLASDLYRRLLATLVNQGFANAFAGIALPNDASVGVHERMGFRAIGVYPRVGLKKGAWRDVGWWGLPLQDLSEAPPPPLTFGSNPGCFEIR